MYCNTTTHLRRAYAKIDEALFKGLKTINRGSTKSHSSTVFKLANTGYVEAMFEDGVKMTEAASLVAIDAAQKWYWDATNNILYFYPTGGVPDAHTYLFGEDFDEVKSHAVEVASREAEAVLDKDVPVPIPQSIYGTKDNPYDRDFAHAVALMACGHIIARVSPVEYFASGEVREGNTAGALLEMGRKIVREYADHTRKFSWEITADEIGGHNIKPASTNTSAGMIQVRGAYSGDDAFWKVKVTTQGALGTGGVKVSFDNGTTYAGDEITTTTDWTLIQENVYMRWLGRATGSEVDFVSNDTWQIEMHTTDRSVSTSGIKTVALRV